MNTSKLSHEQVLALLPDRDENAHKGDFGKILLLCGSEGYTGAAALAAMGALRCGAGLVYLGVPRSIYTIAAIKLTEPIVFPLPEENGMLCQEALPKILSMLPDMDAVLIGPGLGQSDGVRTVIRRVLEEAKCPLVLDADGINGICRHRDILRERHYPTVLTPHAGEFARLGGDAAGDRQLSAERFAREYGCVLLLKGHHTVITDGVKCYVNQTGNPGMAVGGSGDVLAGMITGLIGQGMTPLTAAACGAWIHGAAGDLCAEKMGQYAMLPTDMLEVLGRLLK